MPDPSDPIRGLTDERRARFFAYLDRLPAKDRPVYGFLGQKRSVWQRLGGGATYVVVLFFPDHVVFSTRRTASDREARRTVRLLAEIESIEVTADPLRATVSIRFVDGDRVILGNVARPAAAPLTHFVELGLAAFARPDLTPDAVRAFFVACSRVLPLPRGLFIDPA